MESLTNPHVFHFKINSHWDIYENERYTKYQPVLNRITSIKLRDKKLERRREVDPNFCKKSQYNYKKYLNNHCKAIDRTS